MRKTPARLDVTPTPVEETAYAESRSSPAWPNALVLLLCFLAPPLGLLAWVLGNPSQRGAYLRSRWVRTGLTVLLVGSAPLVAIIVAAKVGLWPDPDPNPVGPGMLFFWRGWWRQGA